MCNKISRLDFIKKHKPELVKEYENDEEFCLDYCPEESEILDRVDTFDCARYETCEECWGVETTEEEIKRLENE